MAQPSSLIADLDKNAKALDRAAEIALEEAKARGADACKVSTSASFEKRLVVESGAFSLANSLDSRQISLLVHKDQKKGSASLNSLDEQGIRRAVRDALDLAKYSVPDPFLTMATAKDAPKAKVLPFMFDEKLAALGLDSIQAAMAEGLAVVQSDARVALERFEMSASTTQHGLYNSFGVKQFEQQTQTNWSFFGMARDGDEVTGYDFDGSFSYNAEKLADQCMASARLFSKKVTSALKPRPAPSYKGPILLSPRAVQELLVGFALYHASGRQVMDGRSKWADSVGKKVVSALLKLSDRPHDKDLSGATGFDGDGLPTRDHDFVDQGVLKEILYDLYSAKRLGQTSNACSGAPFSLHVAPGSSKLQDLLNARPAMLLVDRFSGNTDPIPGDFSGVAKCSRLIEKGQDVCGVAETMIAGNFFDVANAVLGVSREQENVSGGFKAPYVLIDHVSVTGQG